VVVFTKDIPARTRFKVGHLVFVSTGSARLVDSGSLVHVDVQSNVYGIRGIDFAQFSLVTILT